MVDHEIHLSDPKPIRLRAYNVSQALKPVLLEQISTPLESGAIRKSFSPYGFPVVHIKKKDGSYRFCVFFRKQNEVTQKDNCPLPHIYHTLNLHRAKCFRTFDLTPGFHQIPIRECNEHKTAFICDLGLYEFNYLLFGLINSPVTFELTMDTIFHDLRDDAILVYVDDILCASSNADTHLIRLEATLPRQNPAERN